jgi:hypothetical protein
MTAFRNLEILELDLIDIYQATCIIKNSFYLRELRIDEYYQDNDYDTFNFIHAICENCFLIEHLSIPVFPLSENHFIEFEKLLKKCQKLRSLYFKETYCEIGRNTEYGDYLSNVITREASTSLRVIGISYDIRFSLKALETFFEKWKGRPEISIYMDEYYFYRSNESYMELINKYKIEGVIKYINV